MEKNKIMMIIIIVLLVLVLVAVGGLALAAMNTLGKDPAIAETPKVSAEITRLKPGEILTITVNKEEAFITNLAEDTTGDKHVVKSSISIGVNNQDNKISQPLIDEIIASEIMVKEIVIKCMRSFTYTELNTPDGQTKLTGLILTSLQELFDSTLIYEVYSYGYIVQ